MDIAVWEAECASASLQKVKRVLLEPGADELVLEVLYCGLCHSDLSMIDNSWGVSQYPLVPGHEVVGRVVSIGAGVDSSVIGQIRGLGWIPRSLAMLGWRDVPLRSAVPLNVDPSLDAVLEQIAEMRASLEKQGFGLLRS